MYVTMSIFLFKAWLQRARACIVSGSSAFFYLVFRRFVSAEEMKAPWNGARFEFEINLDESDDSDDDQYDDMSDFI